MAAMFLLHWTRWPPELKTENLQTTSRHWPMTWFQNICTEVFHQWPATKITKMAPLGWTKWRQELKIEKPFKDISSAASVLILKWFHRNVPLIPLYPNCQNSSAMLNKMIIRARNRKKKPFKRHLRGQWQDFKISSHQCSSYALCQNG